MKRWFFTAFVAVLASTGLKQYSNAQHVHKHITDKDKHTIVCYYSETPNDRYLPPPEAYRSRLKSGGEAGAEFKFIIRNSPSSLIPGTLKTAGEIWGSLIYSPVPITVEVIFAEQGQGTLASTGVPWPPYVLDNNGNLSERIYIQTLAEKMLRRNLNGNEPDMTMTFNSNVSWYYGDDGNTPSTRYDFLTTVLHEMAHGLGFFGFFGVDDNGIGGGTGIPGIMDGFFANNSGEYLSDTILFPSPSKKLGDALTTDPVRFLSPVVSRELPGEAPGPKMYIPSTWRGGNSLYHVESRYALPNVNDGRDALMTFSTSPGEALHDPGPLATNMLYQMGWIHTYVLHDTLKDRESIEDPFTVSAEIIGDRGIMPGSQYLYYSFDGAISFDSIAMSADTVENIFSADIPVVSNNITVNYYIQTRDSFDRVYSMPATAPETSLFYLLEAIDVLCAPEHLCENRPCAA